VHYPIGRERLADVAVPDRQGGRRPAVGIGNA